MISVTSCKRLLNEFQIIQYINCAAIPELWHCLKLRRVELRIIVMM